MLTFGTVTFAHAADALALVDADGTPHVFTPGSPMWATALALVFAAMAGG